MTKENEEFTYSPADVIQMTLNNIEIQISDLKREELIIRGKIEALQSVKDNLTYMKNHKK